MMSQSWEQFGGGAKESSVGVVFAEARGEVAPVTGSNQVAVHEASFSRFLIRTGSGSGT
jgi:hypothetical protein